MSHYLVRRLLQLPLLLLIVSLITFVLIRAIPGDPVSVLMGVGTSRSDPAERERMRERLGLNDPLPLQYLRYLGGLAQGDLGVSITTRTPVAIEIAQRIPATLELTLAALTIVVTVGVPLGVIAALRRGSWIDQLVASLGVLGVSIPGFLLGLILILLFALRLGWLPTSGRAGESVGAWARSVVLPAATLALSLIGIVMGITRTGMLEVLEQDYMRTAQAKGLQWWVVVVRHGLPNLLIPLVTVLGLQLAALLGGAVVVETLFAWPGIGRLSVNAVLRRDYPLIMGTVLVFALVVLVVNLLVDLLYVAIDPRLRQQ